MEPPTYKRTICQFRLQQWMLAHARLGHNGRPFLIDLLSTLFCPIEGQTGLNENFNATTARMVGSLMPTTAALAAVRVS
jgi:hypothetical protein